MRRRHSDDRSAEILKEYADRDNRIKAIFHETNLSTSQARKDGVAVSCGKYIMFVDGDDELCRMPVRSPQRQLRNMVQIWYSLTQK